MVIVNKKSSAMMAALNCIFCVHQGINNQTPHPFGDFGTPQILPCPFQRGMQGGFAPEFFHIGDRHVILNAQMMNTLLNGEQVNIPNTDHTHLMINLDEKIVDGLLGDLDGMSHIEEEEKESKEVKPKSPDFKL